MDISKNIADILQLYEFSMAIGESLDYKTNCDNFLTLLLARKNLSGCCILQKNSNSYQKLYSYPSQMSAEKHFSENDFLTNCFKDESPKVGSLEDTVEMNMPICSEKGAWTFFMLKKDLGLFLFENNNVFFTQVEINQLKPIMVKFSISLEACESFSKQQTLLKKLTTQNKELKEYAHVISHDLKSPLRNINTLIAWTKEEETELNQTISSNLSKIEDNLEKMDNLIDGILTYSSIDKTKASQKNIEIEPFINQIAIALDPPETLNLSINSNINFITFNAFQLEQLFFQLLSNAIKSLNKDYNEITINIEKQETLLVCSVQDNGKGIAKRYHQKIFQMFQTLDVSKKATGVGLSIVKKIVDLYEGEIWIESEENYGTTIHFTLKK